jgi:uncharacterized protein with HEPN domain
MQDEVLKYLDDILFSLNRIEFHLKDIRSFSSFKDAWTVYDAVERRLAIIGEAVWQIDKIDSELQIRDKKKIIGFRHILTHDYDIVSPDIVWRIIQNHLPSLREDITNLLN